MKRFFTMACLAMVVVPGLARADVAKVQVYVLGIHLGNADAVLYGLNNSYDRSKRAHPGAVPLLHRQLRWSIDLAKAMALPTAAMEALDRDLDGLEFNTMRARLMPILASTRAAIVSKYVPQAGAIFDLAGQLTMAGGIARHATMERPETLARWRAMTAGIGNTMAANIDNNKLEATRSLAVDWNGRASRGEGFGSLVTFNGVILKKWQEDFMKAPGWGGAFAGKVIARMGGNLTKADPLDRERKGRHCRVHQVRLQAGVTYQFDLESGNGRPGPQNPGYFDTWLRVEDAQGRTLANNDDGGDGFNARMRFRAPQSGTFRLVVTSYRTGATGSYTLTVRQ